MAKKKQEKQTVEQLAMDSIQPQRRYPFESPSKKSERYARELRSKHNEFTGEPLNGKQASYRMGALNMRRQTNKAQRAWRAKHSAQ